MVKRNYLLLAGFLLIILITSLISAEIIFSDPVTTHFTIAQCSADSGCGEDYYDNEEYYCKDNAVYWKRTFHEQSCKNGSCYSMSSFQEQLVKICEDGCENGKCIGKCVKNEDCKADYYSDNYCQDGRVYRDFHDFFCQVGKCIENVVNELVKECEYGCLEGVCIEKPECCKDSDCGSATSELVCKEDDVYNKITNLACVEEKCKNNIDYKLVEECEGGCEEGKCIKEEKKQERNIKEVEEINYCGDYFCDKGIGENEFNCEEDCKASVFKMHTEEVEADATENSKAVQLMGEVIKDDESVKLSISFLIPVLLLIIAVILIIILVIVLLLKR